MPQRPLKLMCVLAHPDDETLGTGSTLAKYNAEGVETYLLTATRGEHGWFGPPDEYPGPAALGQIREAELRKAADVLGIKEIALLDYEDGELDQADPPTIIGQIVSHLRRVQPDVVITFDQWGIYGHPDHIAICQFTTAAVVQAASPLHGGTDNGAPHQVAKLYYLLSTADEIAAYQEAFGELVMQIDGVERQATPWPGWAVTTRLDTSAYWETVWQAVECHRTQLPGYETLKQLPEAQQKALWDQVGYYRAFSLVNGGRQVETDLFAGLR